MIQKIYSENKENDSTNKIQKKDAIIENNTLINTNNNNTNSNNNITTYEILSFPISFPENIFVNVTPKDLSGIKCIYCDKIPLYPKVSIQYNNTFISENDKNNSNNNKIMCSECYLRLKKTSSSSLKYKIIDQNLSNYLKQIIGGYDVACLNLGCDWVGKLSKLKTHLETECTEQKIKCPNKGCKSIFYKKDLNIHLAQCFFYDKSVMIQCKYCKEEISKNNLDNHLNICKEYLVDCTNNDCNMKIKRKNIEKHNLICPEYNLKCKFWKFGCKNIIKRKLMKNHELKEIYNHYNLVYNYFQNLINFNEEYYDVLHILNKIKFEIEQKEENEKENNEKIKLKEEKGLDPITFEWHQRTKKQNEKRMEEKYLSYNDYIPFTGELYKFDTEQKNIDENIIFFKNEKIIYSGNYFGNIEKEKYYFVLGKNNLSLNTDNNFCFRIKKDPRNGKLPWIAFGLYIENDQQYFCNINYFPRDGFYCIDLESNTYYNGEINYSEKNDDKLNIDTLITLSYLPNNKFLIIKDSDNFEITFPNIPNDKPNLKFCFIFKGKNRAMIDYNY